jgi:hypothetical protein
MKVYLESEGIAPCIYKLSTRWRWVASFAHRLIYPAVTAAGTHSVWGWVGPRAGLDAVAKRKNPLIAPTGIWNPVVQPVA